VALSRDRNEESAAMWRSIAIFLVGGILGVGAGTALGFFLFPYVFPPPPAADQLTAAEQTAVIAKGSFIQANPSDPIHKGKGRVTVYEGTVFLQPDFEVGPGPEFHVNLVPKTSVRSASDVAKTMFVDLGRLRSFKGSQKYSVPVASISRSFPAS
jgi:Electron transfer DM13